MNKRCIWRSTRYHLTCDNTATDGSYCIFHAPVRSADGRTKERIVQSKSSADFWVAVKQLVSRWKSATTIDKDHWRFDGFQFPEQGDFRIDFKELIGSEKFAYRTIADDGVGGNNENVPGLPSFVEAQFHAEVSFFEVIFEDWADFRGAVFWDKVNFDEASFTQGVNWSHAEFRRGIEIKKVKFGNNWSCNRRRQPQEVKMRGAHFPHGITIENPQIKGVVRIEWPGTGRKRGQDGKPLEAGTLVISGMNKGKEEGILDLSGNDLSESAVHLRIQQCDMSNIIFLDTDSSHMDFYDCRWPRRSRLTRTAALFARDRCGDEVLWDEIRETPRRKDVPERTEFLQKWFAGVERALDNQRADVHSENDQTPPYEKVPIWKRIEGECRRVLRHCRDIARRRVRATATWIKKAWFSTVREPLTDPGSKLSPALIRQTYQQLSKRYRENLDNAQAVEFERGAFEMRRLEAKQKSMWMFKGRSWNTKGEDRAFLYYLSIRIWLWLYKWTSRYSANVFVSVLALIAVHALFAGIYTWLHPDYGFTNLKLLTPWYKPWEWPWSSEPFEMALRVSSLDRGWYKDKVLENVAGCVKVGLQIASLTQTIAVATLLTMFGLTMRRKFKH